MHKKMPTAIPTTAETPRIRPSTSGACERPLCFPARSNNGTSPQFPRDEGQEQGDPPSAPLCLARTCLRALSPQDVHAGGVEEVL